MVVETRSPVFGLFWDLDAKLLPDSEPPPMVFWEGVFESLAASVKKFFGLAQARTVVCASVPQAQRKQGFHVHHPGVLVTAETARACRSVVLASLNLGFAHDSLAEGWDAVVDEAVFKGSGLRMAYNLKSTSDDRRYLPALDSGEDGASFVEVRAEASLSALRGWLRALSIRRVSGEVATPVAEQFEGALEAEEEQRRTGGGGGGFGFGGGGGGCVLKRLPPEAVDALDSALPEEHRGTLNHVTVKDSIAFFRSSSKRCGNVDRDHTANTIYYAYKLSSGRVHQRCFSAKCKGFAGPDILLPGHAALTAALVELRGPVLAAIAEDGDDGGGGNGGNGVGGGGGGDPGKAEDPADPRAAAVAAERREAARRVMAYMQSLRPRAPPKAAKKKRTTTAAAAAASKKKK